MSSSDPINNLSQDRGLNQNQLQRDIEKEDSLTLKVKQIVKRQPAYYLYVGINPALKKDYHPYQLVVLKGKQSKRTHVAILESLPNIKGLQLSENLAHNLGVSINDKVQFEQIHNTPIVYTLEISQVPSENDTQVEDDFLDTVPVKARRPADLALQLVHYVKTVYSYSYITNGHEFVYKNKTYQLKTRDCNKTHYQISPNTKIIYRPNADLLVKKCNILGLQQPYQALKQCITWPKYYKEDFDKLNIETPKGILLFGPPGCGKTHLVRQLSKNTDWSFHHVKGPQIVNKYLGSSEKHLRQIFDNAKKNQPAIIFFDEFDSLGSKRGGSGDAESRIVSQLLTCMDGLENRGQVLVIAATNLPDMLDPSLRRPGRFDKQIEVKAPTLQLRHKLLEHFLDMKKSIVSPDVDLGHIAKITNGFVNADLKLLVNEAKLNVLRRKDLVETNNKDQNLTNPENTVETLLTKKDFQVAFKNVRPSLLREYTLLRDATTLDSVIGYSTVKKRIFDQVYFPLKYPNFFNKNKLKRVKGIILNGPPGTGKTSLARALASQLNYNFITLSGSQVSSKYVGQTENKIKEIFSKARSTAPCIIFFDQIEAIFGNSREMDHVTSHDVSKSGQLLAEMDGILTGTHDILLIGTTNKTSLLDPALLRSGRFELVLTMDYPNRDQLRALFVHYFRGVCKQSNFSPLINYAISKKLTGADIEAAKRIALLKYASQKPVVQMKLIEQQMDSANQVAVNLSLNDIKSAIKELQAHKKDNLQKQILDQVY